MKACSGHQAIFRAACDCWQQAQPLDDGGVGHAAAVAHRLQSIASAALVQRVDQRGHSAGTAGTQRVADHDRAAIDIRPI